MKMRSFLYCVLACTVCFMFAGCGDDDGGGGNNNITNNNNNNVVPPNCGDGNLDSGEACDDGSANSDTTPNACRENCSLPSCGDGVTDDGAPYNEECDPPNGSTCLAGCVLPAAACDEANSYDTDCSSANSGQYCWDGGDGGDLFCGCDPSNGDADCQMTGYGSCNASTGQCVPSTTTCGDDSHEPNDTEATATSMTPGTSMSGAVCDPDEDWFTFTTGANETAAMIICTWNDDGETDVDLRVTDCAGNSQGSGASTDPAEERLAVTGLDPSTTYCLFVNHYAGPATGDDVAYEVVVTMGQTCMFDSDCTSGYCPYVGDNAGLCQSSPPANAGCGDDTPGDNDTSSGAEALSSGTPITEGTCDGEPNGPVDVDFFTFTTNAVSNLNITVDQTSDSTGGDVDVYLYDSNGDRVASAITFNDPETIDATGIAVGTYYVVVKFWDSVTNSPMSDSYSITMTLNP